jgi:hypothetical protein
MTCRCAVRAAFACLLLSSALAAPARAEPARDCAFGVLVFCLVDAPVAVVARPTRVRVELLAGYKPINLYYADEIRGCRAAGCRLDFAGPSLAVDAFYNVAGNQHSDDYVDVGVSISYMPVVSRIEHNDAGFQGELGPVSPGAGSLAYVPVRLTVRRGNFLSLVKSKYLISAFGAGVALPVARGEAGASFTGGTGLKPTLGGRLGAQIPLTDTVQLGLATSWSVIWYGRTFGHASFMTSYGLNLAFRL